MLQNHGEYQTIFKAVDEVLYFLEMISQGTGEGTGMIRAEVVCFRRTSLLASTVAMVVTSQKQKVR